MYISEFNYCRFLVMLEAEITEICCQINSLKHSDHDCSGRINTLANRQLEQYQLWCKLNSPEEGTPTGHASFYNDIKRQELHNKLHRKD